MNHSTATKTTKIGRIEKIVRDEQLARVDGLRADNPGPMTLDGANSYLFMSGGEECGRLRPRERQSRPP